MNRSKRRIDPPSAGEVNKAIMMKKCVDFKTFSPYVSKLKLNDLNDDCLAHIFQFLSIDDLYAVGCTSPRFAGIVRLFHTSHEYNFNNIDLTRTDHFLQIIGHHIETMNVNLTDKCDLTTVLSFFDSVQMYCQNIRNVTINKWRTLNFNRFDVLLRRLRTLRLQECRYQERYDILHRRFTINPWIIAPATFYSLSSANVKTDFLNSLVNVTTLKLHQCIGIRPEHLLDFLEKNDRLVELSLFNLTEFKSDTYNQAYFEGMTKHMQSIEFLSIDMDTTSEIQFIAKLSNLRSLQLINYSAHNERVVDTLLRKLLERDTIEELDLYHCNLGRNSYRTISLFKNLVTLKLCKNFWVTEQHLKIMEPMKNLRQFCCFDCILLSDDGVVTIVKMAPKLESLDCSWCFQVTNRTVHEIINLLSEQKDRPKLEILAGGRTKMTESILDASIMTKNPNLLTIKFDLSMPITCILQDSFCFNCKTIKSGRT